MDGKGKNATHQTLPFLPSSEKGPDPQLSLDKERESSRSQRKKMLSMEKILEDKWKEIEGDNKKGR